MPECGVVLAHCAAYLALASKSVVVYRAFGAAQKAVRDSAGQNERVPMHLRNAPTKLMKELRYEAGRHLTRTSRHRSKGANSFTGRRSCVFALC
ncbi:hypothetical protein SASPL_129868 [Salvia splendens]|uniref:MgsA AAA+ ATPase C-terminal domain-containing protein n=1 Tax=Salvia splendens TaxID=180675 RepID=A0A8X8XF89_SALSN|nr:hypothetical protein SASPL_129868 [Salvia splendens]